MTKSRAGRSVRILLSTACLALVLASCGGGDDDDDEKNDVSVPTQTESAPSEPADSPAPQDDASLSLEDAAAAAVKAVDNSSLLTIETELNRTIWEATVVKTEWNRARDADREVGRLSSSTVRPSRPTTPRTRPRIAAWSVPPTWATRRRPGPSPTAEPKARLLELNLDMYKDRIPSWEGHLYGTDGI